jgi:hypothetical protein
MANAFVRNAKSLWSAWKRLAHKIGNFQARVLLTVLYAVVVLPFGVAARALSDSLRIKKRPTGWTNSSPETHDLSWAQKQ